jgi:lysyl-tRNA synthetase class 2
LLEVRLPTDFSELNDPEDQRGRFLQQVSDRLEGDQEAHLMDENYTSKPWNMACRRRLARASASTGSQCCFTDAPSIREVILFPHMKAKSQ